jgi:hypothetical protein
MVSRRPSLGHEMVDLTFLKTILQLLIPSTPLYTLPILSFARGHIKAGGTSILRQIFPSYFMNMVLQIFQHFQPIEARNIKGR